jgi:tetratricopeptide (TPR) repeat protein
MADRDSQILVIAQQGVEWCQRGDWRRGLDSLSRALGAKSRVALPPSSFSYLGYGLALFEGRFDDGVRLCRRAVELEASNPELHLNLARALYLAGRRGEAVQALGLGLRLDPRCGDLLAMQRRIGSRRQPVIVFLHRDHILNRLLGRLRHALLSGGERRMEAPPTTVEA